MLAARSTPADENRRTLVRPATFKTAVAYTPILESKGRGRDIWMRPARLVSSRTPWKLLQGAGASGDPKRVLAFRAQSPAVGVGHGGGIYVNCLAIPPTFLLLQRDSAAHVQSSRLEK